MFTHAEEAPNAKDHVIDLAGLVDDQLLNVANLLVVVVVYVNADHLGSPPLAIPVDRRIDIGAIGGGILRKGRTSQKRGAELGSCQIVRFHFNLQCDVGVCLSSWWINEISC